MVVEISEFSLTIYCMPAPYLLLKTSPNSILEYSLQQYLPTASCSSHHGHLTCSRHVCVGVWIEVRISDRVWMEGLYHMSGELFLLIEPNAAFFFHWNSMVLLTHVWLMAHSIPLICFFPEFLHNQLFPGLYLSCWLFQPKCCWKLPKKLPTLIKIPLHTLLQLIRLAMRVKCISPWFCTPVPGFTFTAWAGDVYILTLRCLGRWDMFYHLLKVNLWTQVRCIHENII